MEDFEDHEHGGFFTTAVDHETLILRGREGADGATPSGNAVAASVLARLSFHFDREDFRTAATNAVRAYGQQIGQVPRGFPKSLMVVDLLLRGPIELALIGGTDTKSYTQLRTAVNSCFVPYRIMAYRQDSDVETSHPLLTGKTPVDGKAALYVCKNFACQAPITDPEAVPPILQYPQETLTQTGETRQTLTTDGLPGHATPQGTGTYVAKILASARTARPSSHGYTALGSTRLTTSRIGFGGYRISLGVDDHRNALEKALQEGCNLIDTSTNYADGQSERLVGTVVKDLIAKRFLSREEIIIVSKIGYVQGNNLARAESREQAGKPFPEMVKYGEGIWHCLHPEFLEEQLILSLDRLGLATLDVCLLHNPEYFLSDAKNRNLSINAIQLKDLQQEFYRRLEQAFVYFESQVAAGRMQYYGVSSNTCTAKPDNPESTSLSRMLEAAQAAAHQTGQSQHHFGVLQLPMNLFEAGALLTHNTGKDHSQTVLSLAREKEIAVLVNRPLNAIPGKGGGMIRLADPQAEISNTNFEAQQPKVAALEHDYKQVLGPNIPQPDKGASPLDYFTWAEELKRIRESVQNVEHWDQIESQTIGPHVNRVFQLLTQHFTGRKEEEKIWESWRDKYVPELVALLKVMRMEAAQKSAKKLSEIGQVLDPLLPEDKREESFSRKALWTLASTPGITSVLNGMRHPVYVDDSLAILQWEPLPHPRPIFEALQNFSQF